MRLGLLHLSRLVAAIMAAGTSCSQAERPTALGRPSASSDVDGIRALRTIVTQSQCAAHNWAGRGVAPLSYIEGVTLVFARSVCQPQRIDVKIVSAAVDKTSQNDDALAVYQEIFEANGMRNDTAGADTLRHSYVLLIGLGMMESSGKYCEGRDVSECFAEADSAEAGLFQTSYGARRFSPALPQLFQSYSTDQSHCLLDVFQDSLTCPIRQSHNPSCPSATSDVAGAGPGADWQRLTKSCPAFATEYGAVVLRTHGGLRGEFNPIRKRQAEIRPECDNMLQEVQIYIEQHHEICSAL